MFWKCAELVSGEPLEIPKYVQDFRVLTQLLNRVEEYMTNRGPQQPNCVSATLKRVCALLDDISDED